MKFLYSLICWIFCGSLIFSVQAQTSVNLEKVASKVAATSPQFIEGIEIGSEGRSTAASVLSPTTSSSNFTDRTAIVSATKSASIEQCGLLEFKYAMLMNREVETFGNTILYSFINLWWATPYLYGGATKYGIDCSGFTGKLLSNVYGISVPRTAAAQYGVSQKIALDNLKEGDLVFFNTRGGVSHVGFYLGDNYFVHSSVNAGVTISSLQEAYYKKTFIGGGRVVYP